MVDAINKPFKTNLAPWCYKWDWTQGRDGYPRGVRYRATYGANNKPDYNLPSQQSRVVCQLLKSLLVPVHQMAAISAKETALERLSKCPLRRQLLNL